MRAVVTGDSGFLGGYVVKALMADPRITSIVGISRRNTSYIWDAKNVEKRYYACYADIVSEGHAQDVMGQLAPDIVFHLAAHPTTRYDEADPTLVTRINVLGTHNLLAYCPPGCRFVLASSATVYGDRLTRIREGDRLSASSVYGATKVAAEKLVEAYTLMGRVNGLSLRYIANVGAGAWHGLLPDLVRKLHSDSPTLKLIGESPGSAKPFMHASDTAAFTVFAGLSPELREPINVGPYDFMTVQQVAELAMDVLGIRKVIEWDASAGWKGDNRFVAIDNAKMLNIRSFQPRYTTSRAAVAAAIKELA